MDFALTEEQKMLQSMAKDFATKEVEPRAKEIDQTDKFPFDLAKKIIELNLIGLTVPEKYGGSGMGYLAMAIAAEQIAQASCVVGGIVTYQALAMEPLIRWGTEEQKQKYLVPLAKGEKLGCFAFTEPATGTDPRAIKTTAKLVGNEYVLNGQKSMITVAGDADIAIVFAKGEDGRVSAYIIETKQKGYSAGNHYDKMGYRGSHTADMFLDDVRTSKDNQLGPAGDGYKILTQSITTGKIGWGARGTAMAQAALDEALKYSKERIVGGKPISQLLNIQWLLSDIQSKVTACRWLTYRVAWLRDQGKDIAGDIGLVKYFVAIASVEAVSQALQVHGSYGYTKDFKIERLYRDAKVNHVIEGSLETQRLIIANAVLNGTLL